MKPAGRTAGPGRGRGWAGRRQLHTFEKPARTGWERRGRDAVPRLGFLKLGTRPLADTGEGRPPGNPSAELGLEAPRPAHPSGNQLISGDSLPLCGMPALRGSP